MARLEVRSYARLLPVLCLLAPACTVIGGSSVPSVAEAAQGFVAAWNDRDAGAMSDYFGDTSRRRWPEERLQRLLDRVVGGAVSSFEVALPTEAEQPGEEALEGRKRVTVPVPYSITYRSEEIDRPGRLEGEMVLTLDDSGEEQRWTVAWRPMLLWPRVKEAAGFDVSTTLPKRGPILDRRGRRVAVGPAKSRSYPWGSAGGTTIGHIAPVTRKQLEEAGDGYEVGDLVGASGLEKAYEEQLAGEPATKLEIVDRKGNVLRVLARTGGTRGEAVRTTIDIRMQRAAEVAYGSGVGGAVVLDPETGDLLAVVDSSEFNPGFYVGVPGIEPFNRALSGLYPPGSAMKVVTASAALETGVVTPGTTVTGPGEYKGVRNFESGTFGSIPFAAAVQNSVNTAFAQVAEKLGPRRLTRFARAFGFNKEGSMPLGAATSSFPFPQDEGDLMWGAIGQAQVLATPLQMATVAGTVANGGVRMEPRASRDAPKEGERVISRRTARTMTQLMRMVVTGGTGTAANISGFDVAGKTGTAEVDVGGQRLNHAWFVCFAPASDPKVAVAVVSEYGGVGGQVAAPIAGNILRAVFPMIR